METLWKPQPARKLPQPPASNREACVYGINRDPQISPHAPQGHGKEGVVGSSPTEGSGGSPWWRDFRGSGGFDGDPWGRARTEAIVRRVALVSSQVSGTLTG
jgi:hypothetical protein